MSKKAYMIVLSVILALGITATTLTVAWTVHLYREVSIIALIANERE